MQYPHNETLETKAMNEQATAIPSAPPMTSCASQTQNAFLVDDDDASERAHVMFETTLGIIATVGSLALALIVAVASVLEDPFDLETNVFWKKMEIFAALRGFDLR
jgi:hypothetical protein